MNIKKYIPLSEDYNPVSRANETGAGRGLLSAARIKRDEIRKQVESNPQISNDIKKDFRYQLGQTDALNFMIDLPGEARKQIEKE